MTTEQTAQQLELAAQILRTGHPFEVRHDTSDQWHASLGVNPAQAVLQDWHIRLVLATPPDNRPLHNPGNLTAEQVGVGYRLALTGERIKPGVADFWNGLEWRPAVHEDVPNGTAFRLPLSVPWPEPADPYAELKAAHAAGKVIEFWSEFDRKWESNDVPMAWCYPPERYRIKPEPAFQLPPCAPGMRWHREDGWKEGDLPSGYRPLVAGETLVRDEPFRYDSGLKDWVNGIAGQRPENNPACFFTTTRPLTFEHAGKTWTYHRPGDPMPCDGERVLQILLSNGEANRDFARAKFWDWKSEDEESDVEIIGWRYADEKKTVPLGPEDVPPCSAIRGKESKHWFNIVSVHNIGISISSVCGDIGTDKPTWGQLAELADINRSIPLTGKWNPDAWEPCSKEIPA